MRLQQILYEIKVTGDLNYLKDLVRDNEVKSIINNVCKRNKCKSDIVRELLKEYTVRYYRMNSEFVEERYLNSIKKYLGRKARQINGRDINNR